MNDECTCPCHAKGVIMHIAPCCERCPHCGLNIRLDKLVVHESACAERQVSAVQKIAAIEDVLVAALVFYADPGNWNGDRAKAVQDRGEMARQALSKVPFERKDVQTV